MNAFFAALFQAFWVAYFDTRARYESATRELPPDEDQKTRAARIAAAVRGLPEKDRPPG